jgi:hypothetical protein
MEGHKLLTDVDGEPNSCSEEYVTQLEDAGIRGCQGRDAGATAPCDHVSAGTLFENSQTEANKCDRSSKDSLCPPEV